MYKNSNNINTNKFIFSSFLVFILLKNRETNGDEYLLETIEKYKKYLMKKDNEKINPYNDLMLILKMLIQKNILTNNIELIEIVNLLKQLDNGIKNNNNTKLKDFIESNINEFSNLLNTIINNYKTPNQHFNNINNNNDNNIRNNTNNNKPFNNRNNKTNDIKLLKKLLNIINEVLLPIIDKLTQKLNQIKSNNISINKQSIIKRSNKKQTNYKTGNKKENKDINNKNIKNNEDKSQTTPTITNKEHKEPQTKMPDSDSNNKSTIQQPIIDSNYSNDFNKNKPDNNAIIGENTDANNKKGITEDNTTKEKIESTEIGENIRTETKVEIPTKTEEEDKSTKEKLESGNIQNEEIKNTSNDFSFFTDFGDDKNSKAKTEGYIETIEENLDDIEGEIDHNNLLNSLTDTNGELGEKREEIREL